MPQRGGDPPAGGTPPQGRTGRAAQGKDNGASAPYALPVVHGKTAVFALHGAHFRTAGETAAVSGAFVFQRAHEPDGGHFQEKPPMVALFHRQAPALDSAQHAFRRKGGQGMAAEGGVGPAEVVLRRDGAVAEIGPAATAGGQLAAGASPAFEQEDAQPPAAGLARAGKPGGPGAEDQHIHAPRARLRAGDARLAPPRGDGRTAVCRTVI